MLRVGQTSDAVTVGCSCVCLWGVCRDGPRGVAASGAENAAIDHGSATRSSRPAAVARRITSESAAGTGRGSANCAKYPQGYEEPVQFPTRNEHLQCTNIPKEKKAHSATYIF